MDVKYTCRIEDATVDPCVATPASMHEITRENSSVVMDILSKVRCLRDYLFADSKNDQSAPQEPNCLMDELQMQGAKLRMTYDELSIICARLGL